MRRNFSQYDKESYKESKRRRKQAMASYETGFIKPIGSKKTRRPVIITTVVLAVVCVAAAIFTFVFFNPQKTPVTQPENSTSAVSLRLVSKNNPLKSSEIPELTDFDGFQVSLDTVTPLREMYNSAQEQGITLKLVSGYISYSEQEKLYKEKLAELMSEGSYTEVRAQSDAQKLVPQAGCSEAQTGLLIGFDISDTKAQAFIERNCVKFGFILRYPEGKEELTHMNADSKLYRYVGKDNAVKMRSFDMCLEEYVNYIESGDL